MKASKSQITLRFALACLALSLSLAVRASAQTETVLYNFCSLANCNAPSSKLVLDSAGNLYGTTVLGGSNNVLDGGGVLYEITP